jgi:hypothetical protein
MKVAVKNSKTQVDVANYRPVNKGFLSGFFSLVEYAPDYPLGRKTKDCKLFSKDGSQWIAWPDQEVKARDGVSKSEYFPYVLFVDKEFQKNLSDAAVEALKHDSQQNSTVAQIPSDSVQSEALLDW